MDHAVLETDRHRYVVVSHLAEGGMGSIYLGRRTNAGGASSDVVLKQLLHEHAGDPKLIEMFIREAKLSSRLHHRNIVRTLDAVHAGEDYYIVMEYVRGGDLRTLLQRARRRQAKLSIDSALFIAREILDALAYAHALTSRDGRPLGLIHRDVSPSNILLGNDGQVKLTDFGIAKAPTQGSVVFKVKGKVGYMSPEQARAENVDVRSDVFSVGIVLHEALVGERLFLGNTLSPAAVVFAQPVHAPSRKRPDVPAELDALVLRALSLDARSRFSSAAEMRDAIDRLAERTGRTLSRAALAEDLRRACGEDSASWLSLDVPMTATLDAAGESMGDGTGVIAVNDDFDEERPSSLSMASRVAPLPSKELTSVIALDEEVDLDTKLAIDPFSHVEATEQARSPLAYARTELGTPLPPETPFDDGESNVRTSVHRASDLSAPMPVGESRRRATDSGRALFVPPVPRASVPPPLDGDVPFSVDVPTRAMKVPRGDDRSTRLTPVPDRGYADASNEKTRPPPQAELFTERSLGTFASRSLGSLSNLSDLDARPIVRTVIGVALLLVLVGLGVGLGILLSGSPDLPPSSIPVEAQPSAR